MKILLFPFINRFVFFFIITALFLIPRTLSAQTKFYIYQKAGHYGIAPWLRYNKVDGGFTGLSGMYQITETVQLLARIGYGFSLRRPRYQIGLEKTFPGETHDGFWITEYYHLTQTSDARVLPDWQNSLTAAIARLDYYDYYDLHGGKTTVGMHWNGVFKTSFALGWHDYRSLNTNTQKSLFDWGGTEINGKKKFSGNHPVKNGQDAWIKLTFDYDPRPSPNAFINTWLFRTDFTFSEGIRRITQTDFAYQLLEITLQRNQRFFAKQRLTVAFFFQSYRGAMTFYHPRTNQVLPMAMFAFDLGGINSLRGYRYREFKNGNRLWLAKVDYAFNGDFFPKTPLARWWGIGWIFSKTDLAFFADAGQLGSAGERRLILDPDGLVLKKTRFSAGAALTMLPWIRLEWAFPLNPDKQSRRLHPAFYFIFNLNI